MKMLIEKISDLNDMIMQNQNIEAFELFYHDDICTQVNDENPVIGKELNRKIRRKEREEIVEFRSAKPLKVTFGEQTTMVEWHLNYVHKTKGLRCYRQVAVHQWENGTIIEEKLYSGN